MEPIQPREYRIAPHWRRCCWYVVIGMLPVECLFCTFLLAMCSARRWGDAGGALFLTIFFALPVAMAITGLRWRLRVDENGVSRRLLFRWDLWSWSDLESGRVRKAYSHTLYVPRSRRLNLNFMDDNDVQEVISIMNLRYVLPPPPELPDSLKIERTSRRVVVFDRDGIHLTGGDTFGEYSWHDVREVRITRLDPVRRNFRGLVLVLPDQEVELRFISRDRGMEPTWQGATAEEINEFLVKFVPEERIRVFIGRTEPSRREDLEKRLTTAKNVGRGLPIVMVVVAALIIAFVIRWLGVDNVKAAVAAVVFPPTAGVVFLWVYSWYRREVAGLAAC